jgi:hypothetical protein
MPVHACTCHTASHPTQQDPAVKKKVEDINKVLYPKAGSSEQQQQQYGQQPPPAGQQPQEQPYGQQQQQLQPGQQQQPLQPHYGQPQPQPPYGQQLGSGQDNLKPEEQPPPGQQQNKRQQYKQQHEQQYGQQYDGTKRGVYRIPKEDGPTQTKERLKRYEQYIRKEFEKYKVRQVAVQWCLRSTAGAAVHADCLI